MPQAPFRAPGRARTRQVRQRGSRRPHRSPQGPPRCAASRLARRIPASTRCWSATCRSRPPGRAASATDRGRTRARQTLRRIREVRAGSGRVPRRRHHRELRGRNAPCRSHDKTLAARPGCQTATRRNQRSVARYAAGPLRARSRASTHPHSTVKRARTADSSRTRGRRRQSDRRSRNPRDPSQSSSGPRTVARPPNDPPHGPSRPVDSARTIQRGTARSRQVSGRTRRDRARPPRGARPTHNRRTASQERMQAAA